MVTKLLSNLGHRVVVLNDGLPSGRLWYMVNAFACFLIGLSPNVRPVITMSVTRTPEDYPAHFLSRGPAGAYIVTVSNPYTGELFDMGAPSWIRAQIRVRWLRGWLGAIIA